MNLVVISHTAHRYHSDGSPMGWGPTAREIDMLSPSFSHIWHLAFLHPGEPPVTYIKYASDNVTFIPLYPAGGDSVIKKLQVFFYAWSNLRIIRKYIQQADAVQLRLPTGMGVYVLPWISWVVQRKFILWVKYAGNWAHPSPPLAYQFQRWFLKRNFQKGKVTINGTWPNQPAHCLTFENPCLTDDEIQEGIVAARNKKFDGPLNILFVGRIETAKGVDKILSMVKFMKNSGRVKQIVLAGEGDITTFQNIAKECNASVIFAGGVDRKQLNVLYSESHVLLLPSASEGFPKVVAEASAYGCVPFVSDVSSLGQYIQSRNGHLFSSLDPATMATEFEMIVANASDLKSRSDNAVILAEKFTYSYYNQRIRNEIIQRSPVQ